MRKSIVLNGILVMGMAGGLPSVHAVDGIPYKELINTPIKSNISGLEEQIADLEQLFAQGKPLETRSVLGSLGETALFGKLQDLQQQLLALSASASSDSSAAFQFQGLDRTPLKKKIEELDWRLQQLLAKVEAAKAQPLPEQLILHQIGFEFNSATLTADSKPYLLDVVAKLKQQGAKKITIAGYASSEGPAEYNLKLSQKRALAVRDFMVAHGIDGDSVEAIGYGEADPIASNATEAGRKQNRRVEMMLH